MADHSKIPVCITYAKPGTEPPLYVAGTFSSWEPLEMDCTTDEDGKHVFLKTVHVPPGTQIQYKFRVGTGDWWVLNDDAPTAADENGNLNNTLTAPGQETSVKPKAVAHLQEAERQRLSSTPIGQVADTAAEVADTAQALDGDKAESTMPAQTTGNPQQADEAPSFRNVLVTKPDDDVDTKDDDQDGPPLFSHECLGAVQFDDDEPPRSPLLEIEERSHHGSVDYDLAKYDLNDPTLERWPSQDRRSIYEAVRKVETGTNEDQTFFLGSPLSPLVGARRPSLDEEAVVDSPAPSSPLVAKKLDVPRKKSHSSVTSNKSLTSLTAIAEEDGKHRAFPEVEETEEKGLGDNNPIMPPPAAISVPKPAAPGQDARQSPTSDDDEGVALRSSRKTGAAAPQPAVSDRPAQVGTDSRGAPRAPSADPNGPPRPLPAEAGPSQSEAQAGARPDEMDELDDTDEDEDHAPGGGGGSSGSREVQRRDGAQTSHSARSNKDVTGGRWLPAFFRMLFYDWIGGLFGRLFRRQQK